MEFLDENLFLESDLARELYRTAKDLPIIDYHSHLSPQEIAEDKRFFNLTQLWLAGDHYKWRLMRHCGVPEDLVTGKASDREKFRAFASVLPRCIGNPVSLWCHMELKKYFGIVRALNAETADSIYDETEARMNAEPFTARRFIAESGVELLCTTDDPLDDLHFHKALAKQALGFRVVPAFRPDKALNIEAAGFADYVRALTNAQAPRLEDLEKALESRLDDFCAQGCFASDHALDNYLFAPCTPDRAERIFCDRLAGKTPDEAQAEAYRTYLLLRLAKAYHARNMAMQLHFCCRRNNHSEMFAALGPDTGYDCIRKSERPEKLARFLDALAGENALPKTIVYSLDPNDDKTIQTILGCFQGEIRGKLQHGSAWWFNDTPDGIKAQLKTFSEYAVLGNFIGMLTDSRSFTSYARHDFFRRILCNHLAETVNGGVYPPDRNALEEIVRDVCHDNAARYFGIA